MAQIKRVIGRDPACDIHIASPYLSGRHAEIALVDAESLSFTITDLQSTNGTFLNGSRISHSAFSFGDRISLGAYELEAVDFIHHFVSVQESHPLGMTAARLFAAGGLGWALFAILLLVLVSVVALLLPEKLLTFLAVLVLTGCLAQLTQAIMAQVRRQKAEKQYFDFKHNALAEQFAVQKRLQEQSKVLEQFQWQGFRKFQVVRKVRESGQISSFYLEPHDGKPVPAFRPGQYLTFRLHIPGQVNPVIRCYSLSCGPGENTYRVSIKREISTQVGAPDGLVSGYFHEQVGVGDILDIKNPAGHFFLDTGKARPTVLLAGGVGITPMLSMLEAMIRSGFSAPVWLFYGCRHSSEFIQVSQLQKMAAEHAMINVCLCVTQLSPQDVFGKHYNHVGRVSIDLMKEKLGSNNYHFYLCGPNVFMQGLHADLLTWGVPESDIHTEAFGPASVKKTARKKDARPVEVEFRKSKKRIAATEEDTLLAIAESAGVPMEFGCRAGSCGSCEVAVLEGRVAYDGDTDFTPSSGCCLTCVAKATGKVVIDA